MEFILVILVAILGGTCAVLQGPLSSMMGKYVGMMGSVFIVHAAGTILSAVLLVIPNMSQLNQWRSIPWYAYSAGALGMVIIGMFVYCIPRMGAAKTITIMVASQLTIAAILDHFGIIVETIQPISSARIAGFVLLLAGTWLVVK